MHPGVYATFNGVPGAALGCGRRSCRPGQAQRSAMRPRPSCIGLSTSQPSDPRDRSVAAPDRCRLPGSACTVPAVPMRSCWPTASAADRDRGDGARPDPDGGDVRRCVRMGDPRVRAGPDRRDEAVRGDAPSAANCAGGLTCTSSSRRQLAATIRCWNSATTGTWNAPTACPSRSAGAVRRAGRRRGRRDRVYREYGVVVELDGRLAHPAEDQWRDKARDNAAAADGAADAQVRLDERQVASCATALQVAGAPYPRLGGLAPAVLTGLPGRARDGSAGGQGLTGLRRGSAGRGWPVTAASTREGPSGRAARRPRQPRPGRPRCSCRSPPRRPALRPPARPPHPSGVSPTRTVDRPAKSVPYAVAAACLATATSSARTSCASPYAPTSRSR